MISNIGRIFHGGIFFAPDEPPAAPPAPQTPPAAPPPPADPPAAPASGGGDDAAKYRRLFEAEESKRKDYEARLKAFEDDKKKRDEADLTESQKATKRADEAEAEAKKLKRDNVILKVGKELGLDDELLSFVTGDDEATIRANATKLAGHVKRPPVNGGTMTQPGGNQQATLDEKIKAAEQKGTAYQSIALKLTKMHGEG
ncbi:MAG: hypothetical protein P4L33_10595 [Capsulimonadaceae bacterium]|nr:hypothetical protein [Capsulimonadaceae bacterium]